MSLDICHKHHALGDEMHIFSMIWALKDQYTTINLYLDYNLMTKSRGNNYTNYIFPFISALYSKIPNVVLHTGARGISKEQLGGLINISHQMLPQPNLIEIGVVPLSPTVMHNAMHNAIVIPMRIRYPPKNFDLNEFLDLIVDLSKRYHYHIILIGEQKLDKENHEIYTIYDIVTQTLQHHKMTSITSDFTTNTLLYKGEINDNPDYLNPLNKLWYDLNIVYKSKFVLTFGASGFIDLCSFVGTVYTIGNYRKPYTKLIWDNPQHKGLVRAVSIADLKNKIEVNHLAINK